MYEYMSSDPCLYIQVMQKSSFHVVKYLPTWHCTIMQFSKAVQPMTWECYMYDVLPKEHGPHSIMQALSSSSLGANSDDVLQGHTDTGTAALMTVGETET